MVTEKAEANRLNSVPSVSIFGSFHLDETELVVGIETLQEVVPFPDRITKMPLAPDHLLGFFNLRGEIVPVVNLKRILGAAPEASAPNSSQKVAIVECEGVRVGLLFDATGEVLRVRDEARCDFRYGTGNSHPVLSGALKLEGGARVLQVLDASAILRVENIPQILEWQNREGGAARRRGRLRAHFKKCITFRCGGGRLGFQIEGIHEIMRVPALQKSVLKSEVCLGNISLRDRVIPVIDFSRFLGGASAATAASDERRIIVMRMEERLFGLLVDAVENIVSYAEEEMIPIPLLAMSHARLFQGCIPDGQTGDVILLDHREIFSNAELSELTQGHSRLYEAEASGEAGDKIKTSRERQVYISFTLDQRFGLPIGQVHEIIDFPRQILHAPGQHPFVIGLINLRGQMVTIVDSRTLYGMAKGKAVSEKTKVLVLKREDGEKVGFVVDSLESIVTAGAGEKTGLSSLLLQQIDGAFRSDIEEIIEPEGPRGERKTILILAAAGMLRRMEGDGNEGNDAGSARHPLDLPLGEAPARFAEAVSNRDLASTF